MTTFKLAYVGNRAIINLDKMMLTMCLGMVVVWWKVSIHKGCGVIESWKAS